MSISFSLRPPKITISLTRTRTVHQSPVYRNLWLLPDNPPPPGHLELCILTNLVGSYPPITSDDELVVSAMTAGLPNAASPFAYTCLLSGALDEFLPYIGQEQSKWLIDISHDICDPNQKQGSLKVWDAAKEEWKSVNPTDPPAASTYLYDNLTPVSLTKISKRMGKSETTTGGKASTMANHVKKRDGRCWISGIKGPLVNGHICPKRMGGHLFHAIYKNFVSNPPPGLSIYDGICGITLSPNFVIPFDMYEIGLRPMAPVCGSFFSHL